VTTTMVVGVSTRSDVQGATREAVGAALDGAAEPVFALVLAAEPYPPEELAGALAGALGAVPWAGCCSAGVFSGRQLLRRGLVVGVISSPGAQVGIGVQGLPPDGRAAGAMATTRALQGFPPAPPVGWTRAVLMFSDASRANTADVVRGALEIAGTAVVWAGAGVGGGGSTPRAQLARGRAHTDSVVIVALDVAAQLAAGISHGFRPYGPTTLITRAQGAVATELEYEPAFDVYQRTAAARGDRVTPESFLAFATTHPLGIPRADGEHVIRDPLRVESDGSLCCFAEVPDGSLIRVMEGDRAGLLEAARWASAQARAAVHGPLAGAVVFDCVSRAGMLGASFDDELETFASALEVPVPLLGCLSHGEIGALGRVGPQFHNKTAVVLALGR
jgi:hypothetical protein